MSPGLGQYILKGHWPVPCDDMLAWGRYMGTADRSVARTIIAQGDTDIIVSTVFLGLDHGYNSPEPILFETMVLDLPESHPMHEHQERCSTWEQAELMHDDIVRRVTLELAHSKPRYSLP